MKSAFAENLRRHRKRLGLTQAQLGHDCGYAQGHISNLERGALAPSVAVVMRLAERLGVAAGDLLEPEEQPTQRRKTQKGIPVMNAADAGQILAPDVRSGEVFAETQESALFPGIRANDAFAAYLTDDSMAPAFVKSDLVVFSLRREPADGDICLVDTGEAVLFRQVLALPGRKWRLQAQNPKYPPRVVAAGRRLRMWPAIGRWQRLDRGRVL